jgi:hypothetical protein
MRLIVTLAQALVQPLGELLQQLVARVVTQCR